MATMRGGRSSAARSARSAEHQRRMRFHNGTHEDIVCAMPAIHELTAHELVRAYATRELSPLEVIRAAFARMDTWEPRINAMYRVRRDAALADARDAEARWRAGAPR